MEITAKLNHLHIAPRKVRLVAGLIKGMNVRRAKLELGYRGKRSSPLLLKLLNSAVANARHNFKRSENELYIKNITVDGGPVLKRMRPRAFGRGATIRKRTSHVSLVIEDEGAGEKEGPRQKPSGEKKDAPMVRNLSPDDARGAIETRSKGDQGNSSRLQKKNTKGFTQRMFRRKAI